MGLEVLIPLISQGLIPLAEFIYNKAKSGTDVTPEDWKTIYALGKQTPQDSLDRLAVRASVPMTDPRIVALAELIK